MAGSRGRPAATGTSAGYPDTAAVGALLAEPARCRMLMAMADGRALPASALARAAHVAMSTASGHLGRLVDAGWVSAESHGRDRYNRLVDDTVALAGELGIHPAALEPPAPPGA